VAVREHDYHDLPLGTHPLQGRVTAGTDNDQPVWRNTILVGKKIVSSNDLPDRRAVESVLDLNQLWRVVLYLAIKCLACTAEGPNVRLAGPS
jgi:hypothetical protein